MSEVNFLVLIKLKKNAIERVGKFTGGFTSTKSSGWELTKIAVFFFLSHSFLMVDINESRLKAALENSSTY